MQVVIAYEKHDTVVYESMLAILKHRAYDMFYEFDDGEFATAKVILDAEDERLAARFIADRAGYEYENAYYVDVIV